MKVPQCDFDLLVSIVDSSSLQSSPAVLTVPSPNKFRTYNSQLQMGKLYVNGDDDFCSALEH